MNNTPNINLSTYTSDPNDKFNLLVTFNNNMTKIDTAVGSQNDQIELIETTASTAVSTANTASATATEALTTAEGKTSVNDNVASTTTTYSSNKINELISGIQPGTEIDDSVTSTTKTWSSSKINTQINTKASINDTTAGSTTTYSSNKINDLLDDIDPIPYTGDSTNTITYHEATVTTVTSNLKKLSTGPISITTPGYYYFSAESLNQSSTARQHCFSVFVCKKGSTYVINTMKDQPKTNYFSGQSFNLRSNIYYIPANTEITFEIYSDYFSSDTLNVRLNKIN